MKLPEKIKIAGSNDYVNVLSFNAAKLCFKVDSPSATHYAIDTGSFCNVGHGGVLIPAGFSAENPQEYRNWLNKIEESSSKKQLDILVNHPDHTIIYFKYEDDDGNIQETKFSGNCKSKDDLQLITGKKIVEIIKCE